MFSVIVAGGRVRVAATHSARTRAHAADTDRARVGQLLHDLMGGDLKFGGIDLPAVTRCDIAQILWIELPRERGHSEFLDRVGNHLRALVVNS